MERYQVEGYEGDLATLHQLLMQKEASPAVMKEFAYGVYGDGWSGSYNFGDLVEGSDLLARYVALNPYFKAIRWRDYLSWKAVERRLLDYPKPSKKKPLVIVLGAGFLPVLRWCSPSLSVQLWGADIVACDVDDGVTKDRLDVLFKKMFRIDFPDGNDVRAADGNRWAIQYQKCRVEDLFNSRKFLGKADVVIIDGVLLHYPSNDVRQQIVREALYLLKPNGILSCDLMAKFPELKYGATAFGLQKNDKLERSVVSAKNKMLQICTNLSTTLSWQFDGDRNRRPMVVHFEIAAPRHDIDYRLAIGEARL